MMKYYNELRNVLGKRYECFNTTVNYVNLT